MFVVEEESEKKQPPLIPTNTKASETTPGGFLNKLGMFSRPSTSDPTPVFN